METSERCGGVGTLLTSSPFHFLAVSLDRCDQLGDGVDRAAARPLLLLEGSAHEADEERVAAARIRRELGVELAAEDPRMPGQLDHLDEIAGRRALGAGADREP